MLYCPCGGQSLGSLGSLALRSAMAFRILLVDDHEIVREGIKRILAKDSNLDVCGEAGNGQEAVEKVLALKPDLVLMDLSMPVMGGVEATKQIRLHFPDTKIVVLTLHDSAHFVEAMKAVGADAYVLKSRSVEDLIDAIIRALGRGSGDSRKPDGDSVPAVAGSAKPLTKPNGFA